MKKQIRLICFSIICLFLLNLNIFANDNTTYIDVSNMSTGENIIHTHVYVSKYDSISHWNECVVCKDKQNVEKHTITTTWAMGYESCDKDNYATKTCNCGYKTTYNRPCVWGGEYISYGTNTFIHGLKCSVHGQSIDNKYYYTNTYGKGELKLGQSASCINSNNEKINCTNGGTCKTCKKVHNKNAHFFEHNKEDKLICKFCQKSFGSYTISIENNNETPMEFKTIINLTTNNGATFSSVNGLRSIGNPYENQTNSYSTNTNKTKTTITYKSKFNDTFKKYYSTYAIFYISINNQNCRVNTRIWNQPIEITKPTIDKIETKDISISSNTNWVNAKEIIINGTENYTNTVTLEVIDDKGNIIYNGTINVVNQKYDFSFIPNIEANNNEKTYTVNVTDANNNTTSQTFTISKVDAKSPSFLTTNNDNIEQDTTNNTIIETNGWAKTKQFDFYFKDEGIGNVSIGINNLSDMTLSIYDDTFDAYKKSYTFIGDAYEPVNYMLYAKDELGNLSTTTFVIDKIDNTAPTIEKVDKEISSTEVLSATSEEETHNNEVQENEYATLVITANDINEKLGLEGSGIVKYGIQTANSEITWYETNQIEIIENGTYYIYAQDLVGNISQPMLVVVDELNKEVNNTVNVYVTQACTFSVVIPKTIIIDGQTKNATYQVSVKGDIGGLDTIIVTPDTILALEQFGKESIVANVSQTKTTFTYEDGMTSETPFVTNGSIVAPNMSAGSWEGQFNFNIKFSTISENNSIGSIEDDAYNQEIVGYDKEQNKYTTYDYGIESDKMN